MTTVKMHEHSSVNSIFLIIRLHVSQSKVLESHRRFHNLELILKHREHRLYLHFNDFPAHSDLLLPDKTTQHIHPCILFQAFFLIIDSSFVEQDILVFRMDIFSK